tara:strand:- start:780 stop:1550 length:771 start_codon:yes stop_codon:yes gene_type:complete
MKKSEFKASIKEEIIKILSEESADDIKAKASAQAELNKELEKTASLQKEEATEAKFVKFKGDSDDMKMKVEGEREMNTPDGELKVYRVKTADGIQSYTADQVELVKEDLKEVYQTRSKMEQIVDLFQDMMGDEYDGVPYTKVLNRLVKFIDDDYKAAEREGEKFSDIPGFEGTRDALDNISIREEEDDDAEMDRKASKAAKKGDSVSKLAAKLQQTTKEMKQVVKKWKDSEGAEKAKLTDRLKELTKIKKEIESLL